MQRKEHRTTKEQVGFARPVETPKDLGQEYTDVIIAKVIMKEKMEN